MAHSIGTSKVFHSLPMASSDAGTVEQKGAVVFTTIDVSSYPTGGETINAHELGLAKIFGAILQREELAGTPNAAHLHAAIAADGLTMILEGTVDNGTSGVPEEAANASNAGIHSAIVWGESATITENL